MVVVTAAGRRRGLLDLRLLLSRAQTACDWPTRLGLVERKAVFVRKSVCWQAPTRFDYASID